MTVNVFNALDTQWVKNGFSGRLEGLRYESVPVVMSACAVPEDDRKTVFFGLRVMERAALETVNGQ